MILRKLPCLKSGSFLEQLDSSLHMHLVGCLSRSIKIYLLTATGLSIWQLSYYLVQPKWLCQQLTNTGQPT